MKQVAPNLAKHFCNVVDRIVSTFFPEERCPYCKEKP